MAKIRIYELARDLNVTNKELLEKIRNMDIDVKSHMSVYTDEMNAKVEQHLSREKEAIKEREKKKERIKKAAAEEKKRQETVSYTHLTLPTN